MSRWKPDALGRLQEAALELYGERGFEQTTAAQIAERAGLTERTFFRYFADKREVLFAGSAEFQDFLVGKLEAAPASSSPMEAVISALRQVSDGYFEERRSFAQRRHEVILANKELQERELIKLATLAAALADVLRGRGVADPAAELAAEAGITVFRVAFERWVAGRGDVTLSDTIARYAGELDAVTAGR
ncbi:TetR family transcriptional regulator [Amycolatopsis pithecellobii]|uniref:TetR family transcriptional regulator n=1 Tax=Amycolatopsis pithecellobii TaxID=664692 RepID=A0A6N7YYJ1_9PSEU|nr:TetR family transcriptional regulator [Amycolatopsis pithecellobii]MTD56968.1 TetR family transcriptional regulator [Amycolatopsis pithecellobii]